MQDVINHTLPSTKYTHGEHIGTVADMLRSRLFASQHRGVNLKLSRDERARIIECLSEYDTLYTHDGVNFSRLNFIPLLERKLSGGLIEFETLGPYLEGYQVHGGIMKQDNLLNEDAIGLELAVVMRRFFPDARLISLYDDYNAHVPGENVTSNGSGIAHFSDTLKTAFRKSLIELYKSSGALAPNAIQDIDYFLIPESSKTNDAELLVSCLETKGYIQRKGEEIIFINSLAENPLYHRVYLRNSKGKWLCEALDAATFLKAENLDILHIVALPDYMKSQQDKVWEILRVPGIASHNYHNIFYDPQAKPSEVAKIVANEFTQYL